MTALTGEILLVRRGAAATRNEFGYPIAPGEKVWRGGMVGLNSSGQIQRIQTAGTVVFLGPCDRTYDNTASAAAGPVCIGLKGAWKMAVPAASFANIGATVYASDDATLTLTNSGSLLAAGALVGIENGNTFVQMQGS